MRKQKRKKESKGFELNLNAEQQKKLVKKVSTALVVLLILAFVIFIYLESQLPPEFPLDPGKGKIVKLKNARQLYINSDLKFFAQVPASWTHSVRKDPHSITHIQFQNYKPELATVLNIMDLRPQKVRGLEDFLNLSWKNLKRRQIEEVIYTGKKTLTNGIQTEQIKFKVNPMKMGLAALMGSYFQAEMFLFFERGLGFQVIFIYPFARSGFIPGLGPDPIKESITFFLTKMSFLKDSDFTKFMKKIQPFIVSEKEALVGPMFDEGESAIGTLTWDLD
ncbi:hypothetical protein ACFL35_00870 [Candidatus Riflebacteria bacterium]